jgi:hypothetical protein
MLQILGAVHWQKLHKSVHCRIFTQKFRLLRPLSDKESFLLFCFFASGGQKRLQSGGGKQKTFSFCRMRLTGGVPKPLRLTAAAQEN